MMAKAGDGKAGGKGIGTGVNREALEGVLNSLKSNRNADQILKFLKNTPLIQNILTQ